MKIVWAARAARARRDIIDFIAADTVQAALEVDDAITAATGRLADFPLLGKPGRIDGTRELVIHQHYIIVYEIVDDTLLILMALHTSRQWPPVSDSG